MHLEQLLSMIPGELILEPVLTKSPEINAIEYDSRRVLPETLFVAVKGLVTDGNRYVVQALEQGASSIASENPPSTGLDTKWIRVVDARQFLALTSSAFYDFPSRKMQLAGITGTNGKTTTAYLIHAVISQLEPALLMGTLGSIIGSEPKYSTMTTPESLEIQRTLTEAIASGCKTGVLEVSSHSLFFKRVLDCHFKVGVFTNLSQDHLDFHKDFESYFETKSLLFQKTFNPGLEWSLTNIDDHWGLKLAGIADGNIVTYGFSTAADVYPTRFESTTEGIKMNLHFFDRELKLISPLVGRHNGYNIMAAAAACSLLDISDAEIYHGISTLNCVPGRFEVVEIDAPFTVIKDFAHTPDALENALQLAKQLAQNRVICVFGCGGDRDRAKRSQMGKISVQNADYSIITSDNPRSEDPDEIIREIVAGISKSFENYEILVDRRQAIRRSLRIAEPGDLVILAGKGHETYQEINGKKTVFDEREIVKEEACFP